MIPIPPDEWMLWAELLFPFVPILVMVLVGMRIADAEADKQKQKETGNSEAEDLSWTMFTLYGILASAFTMVAILDLLKDFTTNFWMAMSMAGGMGLIFRMFLPKLREIMAVKIESIMNAIFK